MRTQDRLFGVLLPADAEGRRELVDIAVGGDDSALARSRSEPDRTAALPAGAELVPVLNVPGLEGLRQPYAYDAAKQIAVAFPQGQEPVCRKQEIEADRQARLVGLEVKRQAALAQELRGADVAAERARIEAEIVANGGVLPL